VTGDRRVDDRLLPSGLHRFVPGPVHARLWDGLVNLSLPNARQCSMAPQAQEHWCVHTRSATPVPSLRSPCPGSGQPPVSVADPDPGRYRSAIALGYADGTTG
jgi:hypothetical protein